MKKRSFRSTFVSVILVITVAISIVNLAVYGINIKKIRQVEVLKMKTAGERIDDMITISLNNIKGLKQICCTDNYARNILLKNNEKNDIGTKFENQNYMDNALKHIASMDTLILRATIVNKYGNIYCTDTSIPEEYVKTIRNMTKEWMLFEGKEDEYYYGGLQGDNANILTFLYPLHTYGNTPIALLAVDINYKTFQSILENAFYEDSGECFILTGEQELFHIGEDLYQKEEKGYIFDKSQKMMKENLIVDTFQSKGKNFYISSRQNMLSGWKIIQVIPEERLFEEVDQKIKWNSIFLLGALILVVSFSIYYTKKIIEPLEEFCKKISHTKGDQLQIINLEHMKLTREIANVIENYNEMANKMNEYLVREIIYDKNQRKIQSKMLRYQINPHFLYNTLNLIASMGELSDFPEIVEITKNLSCIMQYNVKGSRFVSLKTEVEMVKAYLEIQRIRFHDCFSVEYEIERQIEQVRIVKFILQPIVENIFEHGFTMDENDNKIWIKAFKCENDIVILVKDSYFYMANLDSVTKKAAQMAKQKGSKIFMDADSYTDELLDAISWIDIFIGSEFVYEKMLEAGKSVKENCEYLYNKGPEIVIFTFGEKGCAGISKEGFFEIPAFDVDVKDTVGAGDVFHGAFLAAIVKGLSPKDAARFASGVAAIKCTRIGGRAGIPNWEVTDNFLETGEIDYREIDERVKKYGRGIEYV